MTANAAAAERASARLARPRPIRSAGPARFIRDLLTVAGRATRQLRRELAFVIPALVIPVFFYGVNVGSLEGIAQAAAPGFDVRAFQLPVAIIFAVTGVSRANALVQDISGGYFERLLLTPVNRLALLLGLMAADFVLIIALCIPVIIMGFLTGVTFVTGLAGILAFMLLAAFWGIAFNGFPYAIALKTGNPSAVGASFILFFPFAFLTTAYVPQEALSGWLSTVAQFNPVTYLLAGLRAIISTGWDAEAIGAALLATVGVAIVSLSLALWALRGRVANG
ncbi:MAG TPA: ABC transporter permease [Candidatus Limnocylindrales bacterium]|nr:ABC transporter permease [Candidatus Limnocylindrales bacterium]